VFQPNVIVVPVNVDIRFPLLW